MSTDTPRDCSRNAGFLSTSNVPEHLWVAGAIVITFDEEGKYGFHFMSESLDGLPLPDVQETLGRWAAQAFQLANSPEYQP